ncbi:hypothetical protein A2415_02635 [candidate division WWE3 bacterium RIFOXYC1_FULL_39_7]|uniref:Ribosomal RNA adenine methylase transferase N-terminal domain-containing protein n=2 Tax=Katanobacteria TaxID=422282 RepID=A0A1F4X9N2_UNCKA|nr:MAG: hypothetical protein A2415_02635 [candidate division WWE3 bacterium RIFOXYC1_FULL_39_7]OGC78410.1 MAG: hypothetical protein A2619_00905 [candidate division WWE3 bacterium RIFOXYD1_FULL_39_9]
MWREDRFIAFSQNFISDPRLVKRLLKQSDISFSDTVIDIGAGTGIITQELSKVCGKVFAIEIDTDLFKKLTARTELNVTAIHQNILDWRVPVSDYKVFANIPFNYTSRIMRKLYFLEHPPTSAYLIMQREAANMYSGYPRETQKSLLLKPCFNIKILHKFQKTDFCPKPAVEIFMLNITKLKNPLLRRCELPEYFDFVVYGTTRYKKTLKKSLSKIFTHEQFKRLSNNLGFPLDAKPLDLTFRQWVELYKYFKTGVESKKRLLVHSAYTRQKIQQNRLKKVYRKNMTHSKLF